MRRSLLGSGKCTFTITADQSSTITIGGVAKQGTIYSADFKKGENVSWSVARTGYVTQSGTQKITSDITKNITLVKQKFNVTVTSNVNSTITINGQSSSGVKTKTVSVEYGSTISWSVSATGYTTQSGTFSNITGVQSKNVTLSKQTFTVTVNSNVNATITIGGQSSSSVKTKSVTVEYGSNVSWSVSASGYDTQSGTFSNMTSNQSKSVTLVLSTYSYTVYSNIPGASVYFNGTYKGTISGGSFSTSIQGGDTYYNVTISGGTLPSGRRVNGSTTTEKNTETGTDTDTTTENNFSVSPTSSAFSQGGGSNTLSVVSNYRTGTRTRSKTRTNSRSKTPYTDYSYSRPGQKSVSRNSSVTMNAVESTSSGTSYGSWSYGSWSYGSWSSWSYGSYTRSSSLNVSGVSWISSSKTNTGSGSSQGFSVSITASANNSYDARSGTLTISNSQGSKNISVSQSAKQNNYVFSAASNSLSFGPLIQEKDINITSTKNGSYTGYSLTSKPDWVSVQYISQGSTYMTTRFKSTANTSTSSRSGSIVFTQNESGKTVSVSVSQEGKPAGKKTNTIALLEIGSDTVSVKSSKPVASTLTITVKYTLVGDSSYATYTSSAKMFSGDTRCIINTTNGRANTISNITVSPTSDSTYNYSVIW